MKLDERAVSWEEFAGRRVTVFAPRGSSAARVARGELARAEQAAEVLEELLGRQDGAVPVRPVVYLVDPVPDFGDRGGGGDGGEAPGVPERVGNDGILRTADPTCPPIARPLTRFLVARWYGPTAASAVPFVAGIAGVVAARTGSGTSAEEAHDWVRAELREGRRVSILTPSGEHDAAPTGDPEKERASTSFVAYLLSTKGAERLRRFLAEYDPDRRDAVAQAVYHQPLAGLEGAWLAHLARSQRQLGLRAGLRLLLPLLAPHPKAYAEVLAYQAFIAVVGLTIPLASGCIVGAVARARAQGPAPTNWLCRTMAPTLSPGRLGVLVALLLAVYAARSAVSVRRGYAEGRLFFRIGNELQEQMFAHLQRLPHAFYGEAKVGDLASRLLTDTRAIQACLAQVFGSSTALGLAALAAAGAAVATSPAVGGLIIVVLPILVITHRVLGSHVGLASRQATSVVGEAMAATQENLSAHAVVKAFALEDAAVASFRSRLGELLRVNVRLSVLSQLFEATITLAVALAQLAVLGIGGYLVLRRTIDDPGTLVTLLGLVIAVVMPISSLAAGGHAIQMAAGAMERVREVLDAPVTIADRPGAVPLPRLTGEIRFEAVTFAYEPGRPVLSDLDLTIPAGTSVAVVGPSGSGKSTLVNLLLRFWDPDAGRVLYDGHDLRDVTLASLRGETALVFQETFVFDTTLRGNIAVGRPGASDAEIEAAARAARLDSLVASLPRGHDTVLGERGVRMSGGQRQRLAVARAVLRDPAVLVLDEATSALDARTEAEILETLTTVAAGRTTVTITHRLALAVPADLIVVLDQGRVVEQGSHAELLRAGGLYQLLWEGQHRDQAGGEQPRIGLEAARLAAVPLFSGLGSGVLRLLADQLEVERYRPGDDIVRQAEPGEKLYVLASGGAEVLVHDGRGERRINRVKEGEYFGELALLTGRPRSATVRATVPTEMYSLGRDRFLALVEQEPSLRERLSQLVFARRVAYDAAALATGISTAERRSRD